MWIWPTCARWPACVATFAARGRCARWRRRPVARLARSSVNTLRIHRRLGDPPSTWPEPRCGGKWWRAWSTPTKESHIPKPSSQVWACANDVATSLSRRAHPVDPAPRSRYSRRRGAAPPVSRSLAHRARACSAAAAMERGDAARARQLNATSTSPLRRRSRRAVGVCSRFWRGRRRGTRTPCRRAPARPGSPQSDGGPSRRRGRPQTILRGGPHRARAPMLDSAIRCEREHHRGARRRVVIAARAAGGAVATRTAPTPPLIATAARAAATRSLVHASDVVVGRQRSERTITPREPTPVSH